jgi:hypothetical protein
MVFCFWFVRSERTIECCYFFIDEYSSAIHELAVIHTRNRCHPDAGRIFELHYKRRVCFAGLLNMHKIETFTLFLF